MLRDLFSVNIPYIVAMLPNRQWILLNREKKPIGLNVDDRFWEKEDLLEMDFCFFDIDIDVEFAKKISIHEGKRFFDHWKGNTVFLHKIFLYSTRPYLQREWESFFQRLKLLFEKIDRNRRTGRNMLIDREKSWLNKKPIPKNFAGQDFFWFSQKHKNSDSIVGDLCQDICDDHENYPRFEDFRTQINYLHTKGNHIVEATKELLFLFLESFPKHKELIEKALKSFKKGDFMQK